MESAGRILAIPNKNALWRRMRFYEITGKKRLEKHRGIAYNKKRIYEICLQVCFHCAICGAAVLRQAGARTAEKTKAAGACPAGKGFE